MKIVLDTNVLIASLISRGLCHELLEHCFINHTIVTSEFILAEVEEKLTVKFKYSDEIVSEAVALFRAGMEVIEPGELYTQICRDPDDDNILATGVKGDCAFIVTGDKDLLVLKQFGNIRILSPREFFDIETSE